MRDFIQSARLLTEVGKLSVKVSHFLFWVRILYIKNRFFALDCRYLLREQHNLLCSEDRSRPYPVPAIGAIRRASFAGSWGLTENKPIIS